MINRIIAYIAIVFCSVILTLSFSTQAKNEQTKKGNNLNKNHYQLLNNIIDITKKNYVEEIKDEELFYSAFEGMLSSLDPHSGFLSPDEYNEMFVQTNGEFGGVGIEITMSNGLLKVISPIDDTPAYRAGIKPLDYITTIDGESVRELNINQAVKKIRGPIGSNVKLLVIREGENEPIEFILKRSVIKIKSVKSKILDKNIGYFRITSFSKNTSVNLKSQYKKISSELGKKLSGIILDLRNNPGGLLDQAVGVGELFIDGGVIVSTKGRSADSSQEFKASAGDISKNLPIVVLINEGSASASEIVAGALQDYKRAIIIGTRSFGKGSVQTIIPLNKKVGMRLTTSKYYTPNGRSIQALGITPDIIVERASLKTEESQDKHMSESKLSGHLKTSGDTKDSNNNSNIVKIYSEDYQLGRAVDLVHAISALKK